MGKTYPGLMQSRLVTVMFSEGPAQADQWNWTKSQSYLAMAVSHSRTRKSIFLKRLETRSFEDELYTSHLDEFE